MKHICYSKIIFLILFTLNAFASDKLSIGIYYANDPSEQLMTEFDKIVIDPDQIDPIWVKRYPKKLVAYVSIGEFESWRHKNIDSNSAWILSDNSAWGSKIADLTNEDYQKFLLKKMQKLYDRGYRNFFLDTLDSIFSLKMKKEKRAAQTKALSKIIKKIREKFPHAFIVANRGVEVMDRLCQSVDAFAIESLYKGIDPKNKTYIDIPKKDAKWIRARLNEAKECSLIPIVIDYLPPYKQEERKKIAKKLDKEGYIGILSDIYLKEFPTSYKNKIKREVLILYDSTFLKDGDKVYSSAHLLASMPLEYLGFIPILKDIKNSLPDADINRYAGVIVWIDRYAKDEKRFFDWIYTLIKHGQKILFMNEFGFKMNEKRAKKLGLYFKNSPSNLSLYSKVIYKDKIMDFELPTLVDNIDFLLRAKNARVLVKAQNSQKESFDAAAITSWGGYGLGKSFTRDIDNEPMWSVDPFALFKNALKLASFPAPDPTTQNGRRNLFIHIDGDGFIEKARFNPKKYASQILLKDILKKYPLPHSISIIEGEISKNGLYPKISSKMEKIAKKIFSLPFVEPSSHSFSHPFKWQKLTNSEISKNLEQSYHLPIKNYRFSLKREIDDSISYINEKILKKSEKKCKLFFWTGDCLPDKKALRECEINNIKSINGGDTTITDDFPWLGRIAPFGIKRGSFWQIYVAMQNENIYTNDWKGPFWGYQKVIETFKLTQSPRRLKPLNIYYHFYSASKRASLNALHKVYKWVQKQKTIPIFTSEYIDIAHDFYKTVIFKIDNGYFIKNNAKLRTLRIPKQKGYPDLKNSKGVIGFWDEKYARYIHLDNKKEHTLILSEKKPNDIYLKESNAKLIDFFKDENKTIFKLRSYVKLEASFHMSKNFRLLYDKKKISVKKSADTLLVKARANDTIEVVFVKRK